MQGVHSDRPGPGEYRFGGIKTFAVKVRYKVQFPAEAFNLFDHANFNNPNGTSRPERSARLPGPDPPGPQIAFEGDVLVNVSV